MVDSIIRCGATNLANARLGAEVVFATDDFFADKSRLIDPADPVFIEGKYDENGKWMDGWESRRRRDAGHDCCIIKLGLPARLAKFDLDTTHFTGNFAPAAAIDVCYCEDKIPSDDQVWSRVVAPTELQGDDVKSVVSADQDTPFTHIKLNIFPDGGVARLRAYGKIASGLKPNEHTTVDLASVLNGARALYCNDQHFGQLANILLPGRGVNMGDGWETRRRREPGADWGIIELAAAGTVSEVHIDTAHFKGNFPHRISLQAGPPTDVPADALIAQSLYWPELLPEQSLTMDAEHNFSSAICPHQHIRYVRINLIPDGGISRIRLIGSPESTS